MSAREEILQRVRRALGPSRPEPPDVPRGYRDHAAPTDVVGLFAERVADYRAGVTRCTAGEVERVVRDVLGPGTRVVVPPDLPFTVEGAAADTGLTARELDAVDAVVTAAAVAVAETGTVVLDHGPGQGRRVLTLVPDVHVCVVRAAQVVAGVPDAVALLDPRRPQTWISGPSATSDIELDRIEGVHGPRRLHVVVVDVG
jgi:L-lactate dehydrogenase complex protein LldG